MANLKSQTTAAALAFFYEGSFILKVGYETGYIL